MLPDGKLPLRRQPFERLGLPDGVVALDQVEDARLAHEEAAVDPAAVAARLLDEALHLAAGDFERAEAPRRLDRRHGRQGILPAMKSDKGVDIDIAHAIAVGQAEGAVDIVAHAAYPPARHRLLAGIDQRDLPRLGMPLVDLHAVVGEVEGDIRHVKEVIREIFLDQIALVAAADHEFIDAILPVELHDVPENRPAADLDHRLGAQMRFLADPRAQSARKNDRFHYVAAGSRGSPKASLLAAELLARPPKLFQHVAFVSDGLAWAESHQM
ncbi:hypothetical protein KL86PLE_90320 [uncultured Pleomorphomonas sp.]|uniref:Uncharacterized protein n=1 Tax=uncultured Pleomorphomonas sp. TaxID=442121 RepID=A0A212LP21_9HYPH|nr:hypothetical protein KL86PLE_90320 [uncultured Pleomorphomonas sp.]